MPATTTHVHWFYHTCNEPLCAVLYENWTPFVTPVGNLLLHRVVISAMAPFVEQHPLGTIGILQ